MGSKHGEWFNLQRHMSIHNEVLLSFGWFIKGNNKTQYQVSRELRGDELYLIHNTAFETTNNFSIFIKKATLLSSENPPKYGLTKRFSYNALSQNSGHKIQYHSAHSHAFNPLAPWHDKPHRHEFVGKIQKIQVYSDDNRPVEERLKAYSWEHGNIELTYLSHQNWPFVKEFLDEVANL